MDKVNIAKEKFSNSCNCAQSVLVALAGGMLDENQLMMIASSFGGGIAQSGEVCGAITGALMALGLKRGYTQVDAVEVKANHYRLAKRFINEFEEKYGSSKCRDLIQYDISIPGQKEKARDAGVFSNLCPCFVVEAVEIMDNIIRENEIE